jgi:hypothetical protein
MTVKITDPSLGDTAVILSPPHLFKSDTVVKFLAKVKSNSLDTLTTLDVYLQNNLGENMAKLLSIVSSQDESWKKYTTCVPAGTYVIGFVASMGIARSPYIGVDEVQLDGLCSSSVSAVGKFLRWFRFRICRREHNDKTILCIYACTNEIR